MLYRLQGWFVELRSRVYECVRPSVYAHAHHRANLIGLRSLSHSERVLDLFCPLDGVVSQLKAFHWVRLDFRRGVAQFIAMGAKIP